MSSTILVASAARLKLHHDGGSMPLGNDASSRIAPESEIHKLKAISHAEHTKQRQTFSPPDKSPFCVVPQSFAPPRGSQRRSWPRRNERLSTNTKVTRIQGATGEGPTNRNIPSKVTGGIRLRNHRPNLSPASPFEVRIDSPQFKRLDVTGNNCGPARLRA